MVNKDRLTFEEACRELQVSEDELEQLVADGEIPAMKEGDTFSFKRDAVANYKKSRKTEPTIILADEDMELLDGMEDIQLAGKKGGSFAPHAADSAADLLNFDEISDPATLPAGTPAALRSASAPEETVLNLDGLLEDDGSEGTTPIPGAEIRSAAMDDSSDLTVEGTINDDTLLDTDLLDMGEEEDSFKIDSAIAEEAAAEATEPTLLRGGGARVMQMKRKADHSAWSVVFVLTAVLMLPSLGILLNATFISKGDVAGVANAGGKSSETWVVSADVARGVIEGIADLFGR